MENKGQVKLGGLEAFKEKIIKSKGVVLTGCGTAFYACLYGEYLLEEIGLKAKAILASELKYRNYNFEDEILIAISQSGETIDTLEAVKLAKNKSALTIGIVNVPGSSIAREVHCGIYTYAGPEYAVASTKAFISQLGALVLLSIFFEKTPFSFNKKILTELKNLPEKIKKILHKEKELQKLAKKYYIYKNFLYLGRKFSYITALEGSLKLKEIAYLHSEAYPAGEMKHGPIALIDENFPSVVIAPNDSLYEKTISNLQEIKARKGKVILVSDKQNKNADDLIFLPSTEEILTPFLTTPPLYLFAYYAAKFLKREIDRPRNLAKSVTVE
jgi:glucosamine--fructose-6-phosphate aminotransferase (isomerizing)